MTTREQAALALFSALEALAPFKYSSRRLIEPTQVTPALSPALFLIESGEVYYNAAPGVPARRTLKFSAILYNNAGGDDLTIVPATPINNALDALDGWLAASVDAAGGRRTLGGLVYHLRVEGEIQKAPGEETGFAMAVAPFEIVLP